MKNPRILLVYVGGTLGMNQTIEGLAPKKSVLKENLLGRPEFNVNGTLGVPASSYGEQVDLFIHEFDELLDSSTMRMKDWIMIVKDIERFYKQYDGFVIIHGTDTMAYTASALSFMLEGLGKSVVITGSQIPLSELFNDAVENLLGAILVCAHFNIGEVGLYFHGRLYRGNRSIKSSAVDFDAFQSPNMAPLIQLGVTPRINRHLIQTHKGNFTAFTNMVYDVVVIRLFPGMEGKILDSLHNVRGVVLETFGSGNCSSSPEFLSSVRRLVDDGIVVVNVTQCRKGFVNTHYSTGKKLSDCGVIGASDMTTEAALSKLSYLLGKYTDLEKIKTEFSRNLRGEMTTIPHDLDICLVLKAVSEHDLSLIRQFRGDLNQLDYNGISPLHLAMRLGDTECVELLISKGANPELRNASGMRACDVKATEPIKL